MYYLFYPYNKLLKYGYFGGDSCSDHHTLLSPSFDYNFEICSLKIYILLSLAGNLLYDGKCHLSDIPVLVLECSALQGVH